MSKNAMANKEAGKILADVLKTNTVLTHLDISENAPYHSNDGPGFAQEFAIGVAANKAMTSLTVSGEDADSKPVTIETSMAKADFSGKCLGTSGAIMLASFLPKCQ